MGDPTSRVAGELLRHRLLEVRGSCCAHMPCSNKALSLVEQHSTVQARPLLQSASPAPQGSHLLLLCKPLPLPSSDCCTRACSPHLLQPGGAKEAHCMVEDLLAASTHSSGSSSGSGSGSSNGSEGSSNGGPSSGGSSGLCHAGGGYYPDPAAMLEHQGLLL